MSQPEGTSEGLRTLSDNAQSNDHSHLPTENKKAFVRTMFDSIAPRYDLLNRVLSGGIDQQWRRRTIRVLSDGLVQDGFLCPGATKHPNPARILDVATGTADLAILAAELRPVEVVGVDIAEEMLHVGRKKIRKKNLQDIIQLHAGDAEALPFSKNAFDAALVAFGVRNFANLEIGLREINRVLKPGGLVLILEFSRPRNTPIKQLYSFYGNHILPGIGKLISGDDEAYTYLPESIAAFPDGTEFLNMMARSGFTEPTEKRLTFGIASLYSGRAASGTD